MNPRLDIAWGTDTGTAELPKCMIGRPREEAPTAWLLDLRPEVPATPRTRPSRLARAARRAYTGLIAVGVLTLTGCATVGPQGLADALAAVTR